MGDDVGEFVDVIARMMPDDQIARLCKYTVDLFCNRLLLVKVGDKDTFLSPVAYLSNFVSTGDMALVGLEVLIVSTNVL